MITTHRLGLRASTLCLTLLLPSFLSAVQASDSSTYGHADYYPSADYPAQLRGDGTGNFPGADIVKTFDGRSRENIIWGIRLPGWGFSSPIVVGDKIFVTCDWNKLICVNAPDGKILWVKDNHTFDVDAGSGASADSLKEAFDYLTKPWYQAHATMLERDYSAFMVDLIAAARSGSPLTANSRGGGKKGKSKGKGAPAWGKIYLNQLSAAEMKKLVEDAKNIDDATAAQWKERLDKAQKIVKEDDLQAQTSGYVPLLFPYARNSKGAKAAAWMKDEKRISSHKLLMKHGIVFESWNGWMSRSFSSPASDGKHVYAQFGQSQVVCYDLQGNRKWIKVFAEATGRNMRQNDSASPLIAGDALLVLLGGGERKPNAHTHIRALDLATGEERWTRKLDYVMTSHTFPNQTIVKLDGAYAVATSAGSILNVADGSVIMENLVPPIAPPLVVGNKVFMMCGFGQSNGHGARMGLTLNKSGDQITGTIDWAFFGSVNPKWTEAINAYGPNITAGKTAKKPLASNVGPLLLEGNKIMNGKALFDAATGEMIPNSNIKTGPTKKGKEPSPTGHLVRAGDTIVANDDNLEVRIYNAKDLQAGVGTAYLGSEWQRDLILGKLSLDDAIKAVMEEPWLPNPNGHLGGQTTPWPQGKRLYFRTKDSLYCIGDASVPYHSPSGAPAEARTGG